MTSDCGERHGRGAVPSRWLPVNANGAKRGADAKYHGRDADFRQWLLSSFSAPNSRKLVTRDPDDDNPLTAAPVVELYRDDWLLVVNKPAGLVVHPGWTRDRVTMVSLLRDAIGSKVYPVHRLDRATSGVLVFALDAETVRCLQRAFADGSVVKNYLALTRGIAPELGLIDHAIAKSKQHPKRPSQTAMRRLATFERYSLVEARPYTGRLHQVRRHMKHISHPLIGDTRFGKGEHNRRFRSDFELRRLALHASKIGMPHPVTSVPLVCRADLPQDLAGPLRQLGLLEAAEQSIVADIWCPDITSLPVLARDEVPAPEPASERA